MYNDINILKLRDKIVPDIDGIFLGCDVSLHPRMKDVIIILKLGSIEYIVTIDNEGIIVDSRFSREHRMCLITLIERCYKI